MSANATLALQAALVASLRADAPLSALLGGPKIFDDVPQGAEVPYVAVSGIETRDWGSQTSVGHEHGVTLTAATRWAGRKQALEVLGAIEAALAAPLAVADHKIVSLQIVSATSERGRNDLLRGLMRLRVVTELNA